MTPTREEVENDALAAMRQAGLCPKLPLVMDGTMQRCPVEGRPRGRDGAYCIHLDNWPAGWFQNHVGNQPVVNWKYQGRPLSPEENAQFRKEVEENRKKREAEQKQAQKKVADFIEKLTPMLKPAAQDHPYLVKKQVRALGDIAMIPSDDLADAWKQVMGDSIGVAGSVQELILRLRDEKGKAWTIERIMPDGTKRFLRNGKKGGMWYTIPAAKGAENSPLVIAEGYATGASIHMATGLEIAVALDCGNLDIVAAKCRKKWPAREILFGADNDIGTAGNPGLTHARNAARKVGGRVVLPEPVGQGLSTDWNDVHVEKGLEAVRRAYLEPQVRNAQAQRDQDDDPEVDSENYPPLEDVPVDAEFEAEPPQRSDLIPDDIMMLSDVSNARLLLKLHGENLRYCREWRNNGWLVWDGKRWAENAGHEVTQLAIGSIELLKEARNTLPDSDEKKELDKHVKYSTKANNIRSMLDLAQTFPQVQIDAKTLNARPWLLNTPTGTLDLKRFVLSKHKREDYLTRMIVTEFDVKAECPQWLDFLNTVMDGDAEMIDYLKRAVGYCLTGSTEEQVMFILYGTGRNGKSTFLQVIRELLGDYAKQASMDTFMAKRMASNSSDDLANLRGARMVVASESEENARLSEALVKQITGGGAITARRLYENLMEFVPEFKLWLDSNHKPVIRGTDFGIWRRVRLIPFTVTIPDEKVDPDLMDKLRAEFPGILRWAAQGAKEWQKDGLGHPAVMEQATQDYRAEMDTVGRFLSECCLSGSSSDFEISTTDLYRLYEKWVEENGEFTKLTKKQLGQKLLERGYQSGRNHGGRYWMGLMEKPADYYDSQNNEDDRIPF